MKLDGDPDQRLGQAGKPSFGEDFDGDRGSSRVSRAL
jgi:hypothetical protein